MVVSAPLAADAFSGRYNPSRLGRNRRLWTDIVPSAPVPSRAFDHQGRGMAETSLIPNKGSTYQLIEISLAATLIVILVAGAVSAAYARTVADRIWSVRLSPNARHLAVIGDSGMTLYEPRAGTTTLHIPEGRSVAFSPDSDTVVVSTGQGITVFDIATAEHIRKLEVSRGTIPMIAFSPDSARLAAVNISDSSLQVWDLASSELSWNSKADLGRDAALAFSPNGQNIATGGKHPDGTHHEIRIWHAKTGRLLQTIPVPRRGYIDQVEFLHCGHMLMAVLSDGKANLLWDISDLERVEAIADHPLARIHGPVVLSPDNRFVVDEIGASSRRSMSLAIREVDTERTVFEIESIPGIRWHAAFSSVGSELAVASSAGTVSYWRLDTGVLRHTVKGQRPPRWTTHWNALIIASALWGLLWSAFSALRTSAKLVPRSHDRYIVPLVGLIASVFVVALHWVQIAESVRYPVSFINMLLLLELASIAMLAGLAVVKRARTALLVNLIAFPIITVVSGYIWVDAVIRA